MKLSVSKNNIQLEEIDLSSEVEGLENSEVTFFIGRSSECHICLNDHKVSREHAKLKYSQMKWYLEKASEFGELELNGKSINREELKENDLISINDFSIKILEINSEISQSEVNNESQSLDISDNNIESSDDNLEVEEEESSSEDFDMSLDSLETIEEGDDSEELNIEDSDEIDSKDSSVVDIELDEAPEDLDIESIDNENFSNENLDTSSNEDNSAGSGFSIEDDNQFEPNDSFDSNETSNFDTAGFEDSQDGFNQENDSMALQTLDDDKTVVNQAFARFELEILGEFAPYDKYVVIKDVVVIGRDPEKCDIVLNDEEVSSIHAKITKQNITLQLEDVGSSNGTILNGARINAVSLTNGDEFIIGTTTFTVQVISDLISKESERLMPVEDNQEINVEEYIEEGDNFESDLGFEDVPEPASSNNSLFSKEAFKDPEKRKKLLIYAVVLLGLWVALDEEPKKQKKTVSKGEEKKSFRLVKEKKENKKKKDDRKLNLSNEKKEIVDSAYLLGKELLERGKYEEAINEFRAILNITADIDYKETKQLLDLAKQGLAKIEEADKKRRSKESQLLLLKKIKSLVAKARKSIEDKKYEVAQAQINQIIKADPDNIEVQSLKIELDALIREKERKELEEATKNAERNRMLNELKPAEAEYLNKNWYIAIKELKKFLRIKNMDEDLVKKARNMLEDSERQLSSVTRPLTAKARSLKEGQDLKGAFEHYKKVLKYDPTSEEALNQSNEIEQILKVRSQKVYREAIISESLSLFNDAKEKFQEVKQISPTDSEYYKKAEDKLKEYLE